MTRCSVGDIVSVEFPFSDLQGRKRRHGLVLLVDDVDVIVARVTTQPPRVPSDVVINQWSAIGLPRASTVRLTKIATIDRRLVHHTIGHLQREDSLGIANECKRLSEIFSLSCGNEQRRS